MTILVAAVALKRIRFPFVTAPAAYALWYMSMGGGGQLGKAVYCLLHLLLIVLSIILQRRAFLIFGALGVFIYLADKATGFFRNSFAFTFALTAAGIAFIAAGILFKRNEAALTAWFSPLIPARVKSRHTSQAA